MVGPVVPLATSEQALADAAAAFLAQPSLARSTRRADDHQRNGRRATRALRLVALRLSTTAEN